MDAAGGQHKCSPVGLHATTKFCWMRCSTHPWRTMCVSHLPCSRTSSRTFSSFHPIVFLTRSLCICMLTGSRDFSSLRYLLPQHTIGPYSAKWPFEQSIITSETVNTTTPIMRLVYSYFMPKKSRHPYEEDVRDACFSPIIFDLCELYRDWPQRLRTSLLICAEATTSVLTTGL